MYLKLTLLTLMSVSLAASAAAEEARGTVYHDQNGNGTRDAGEPGLPGVLLSNGEAVVATDDDGAYTLPVSDDTTIFVIKPRGYRTPLNEMRLPRFFYQHKPNGAPATRYPGVDPTGPLPERIDFPLQAQDEPEQFRVLLFGDTQPGSMEEVHWIGRDVVRELAGTDARFAISLGDLVGDALPLFEGVNAINATVGIPFYNVLGNHDLNFDSPDDLHSDETFERVFGPPYYAFEYGAVSFLVLDDVFWDGSDYVSRLGEKQLRFIENYLATLPKDRLIVASMHIPLVSTEDRAALLGLLSPFANTLSLSAHWHRQDHYFLGEEDGWTGANKHHHLVHATVCGAWWGGLKDPIGIPVTTMADGAPNGYSWLELDGNRYKVTFKAARRPADYQMHLHAPTDIRTGTTEPQWLYANVFAGSERSSVEYRIQGQSEWAAMLPTLEPDPFYVEAKEAEAWLSEQLRRASGKGDDFKMNAYPGFERYMGGTLPAAKETKHLWKAQLPGDLAEGWYVVEVRTTDMFGQTFEDRTFLRYY